MSGSPLQIPQGGFEHHWKSTILKQRPLILPRRCYFYPREAEEVERGALEVLITPNEGEPFLATCALGFSDPIAPMGVWSCPDPVQLCAVAGGYAYLIDTRSPERFEQIGYRPVLSILVAKDETLLLFVGNQRIVAYNALGRAWESPRLSFEGIEISSVRDGLLQGVGWDLSTDTDVPFCLDLRKGKLAENLNC